MATYQEQIKKNSEKKEAQERLFTALVDALLPYIEVGKLTENDAKNIIETFIFNFAKNNHKRVI